MSDYFGGIPFGHGESGNPDGHGNEHVPESQKVLQGLLSELPDEAVALIERIGQEIANLQERTAEEVAQIREEAERKIGAIETKAEQRRKGQLQHAIEQLEPLQKDLFRKGDFAQALATFVQIQVLKSRVLNVLPDPGNLLGFPEIGKTHFFRVIGDTQGPVWGSETYTADSLLRSAAVHAGAVEAGEEGVVRVSVVDMAGAVIRGSMRHGVMSMNWGSFNVGYRVARA